MSLPLCKPTLTAYPVCIYWVTMSVREGLLALLDEPCHGYQLKTRFEAATGGIWTLNVGQVYTTLSRLERDGLVSEADSRADQQRSYRLTEDGVMALGEWWNAVVTDEPPPRDELMLKVLLAMHTADDMGLEVITRQRTALTEMLAARRQAARRRSARRDAGAQSLAGALVNDALVFRAEADLRWLDACEARALAARAKPVRAKGNK